MPTVAETLVFTRDMLVELRLIALGIGLRDLAYLIDVARLEAASQLRPLIPTPSLSA